MKVWEKGFIFLKIFSFERQRGREHAHAPTHTNGRGAERKGGRGSDAGSMLTAVSPMRSLNS